MCVCEGRVTFRGTPRVLRNFFSSVWVSLVFLFLFVFCLLFFLFFFVLFCCFFGGGAESPSKRLTRRLVNCRQSDQCTSIT